MKAWPAVLSLIKWTGHLTFLFIKCPQSSPVYLQPRTSGLCSLSITSWEIFSESLNTSFFILVKCHNNTIPLHLSVDVGSINRSCTEVCGMLRCYYKRQKEDSFAHVLTCPAHTILLQYFSFLKNFFLTFFNVVSTGQDAKAFGDRRLRGCRWIDCLLVNHLALQTW